MVSARALVIGVVTYILREASALLLPNNCYRADNKAVQAIMAIMRTKKEPTKITKYEKRSTDLFFVTPQWFALLLGNKIRLIDNRIKNTFE